MLTKAQQFEIAVVRLLNLDGWELTWTGSDSNTWDAEGKTHKGVACVIEMKFRNKHYKDKILEVEKYEKLMETGKTAIYLVSDPKGTFLYWLNNMKMTEAVELYLPDSSYWQKKKLKKSCYLLPEKLAVYKNYFSG
jgi:hypothetical protein